MDHARHDVCPEASLPLPNVDVVRIKIKKRYTDEGTEPMT